MVEVKVVLTTEPLQAHRETKLADCLCPFWSTIGGLSLQNFGLQRSPR